MICYSSLAKQRGNSAFTRPTPQSLPAASWVQKLPVPTCRRDYWCSEFQFLPLNPPNWVTSSVRFCIFGRRFTDRLKFRGWGGKLPPCSPATRPMLHWLDLCSLGFSVVVIILSREYILCTCTSVARSSVIIVIVIVVVRRAN